MMKKEHEKMKYIKCPLLLQRGRNVADVGITLMMQVSFG